MALTGAPRGTQVITPVLQCHNADQGQQTKPTDVHATFLCSAANTGSK